MPTFKLTLAQQRPFSSIQEEALLNVMRSAGCIERAFQQRVRRWGVTPAQYNVLRILRGAHPAALACSEIGARMVAADPDITRLLSRLRAASLIRQTRGRNDHRVVLTRISDAGLHLLHRMDPVVKALPLQIFANLSKADLKELIRLLEVSRGSRLDCAAQCSVGGAEADGRNAAEKRRRSRGSAA